MTVHVCFYLSIGPLFYAFLISWLYFALLWLANIVSPWIFERGIEDCIVLRAAFYYLYSLVDIDSNVQLYVFVTLF